MESHRFADIFPLHEGPPLWEMSDDIRDHGLVEPILTYQGKILDGRRRELACLRAKVQPKFKEFKGTEKQALDLVMSKNLRRRHLGEAERAMAAAAYRKALLPLVSPTLEAGVPPGTSLRKAGETMNVSKNAVARAETVLEHGSKPLQDAVKDGTITLCDAAVVAKSATKHEQTEAVRAVVNGQAKTATQAVAELEKKEAEMDAEGHEIPEKCKPAFASLAKYAEIDSLVRKLQSAIDEVSRMPGGELLAQNLKPTGSEEKTINKSEHLNALKRDLKFTRPHAVCPYCKHRKACTACQGRGWVGLMTYKDAPAEMKA